MVYKGEVSIKNEAEVASIANEELCFWQVALLSSMSSNSVFQKLRVKRLAVIQEEIC